MMIKKECEKCKKQRRKLYRNKEYLYVCSICKNPEQFPADTLEEALKTVYIVKGRKKDCGYIYLPKVLVGKKVVLVLVERKYVGGGS